MSVADPRVAARSTLAAWFTANLPTVNVSENWPTTAAPLRMPALTVLAGPQIRPLYHQPRLWNVTPNGADLVDALYSYGQADMDLQLDVWAGFEAARDALAAQAEAWFNVDPKISLGLAGPSDPVDLTTKPGLVLAMSSYYGTYCEYTIDPVAGRLPETNDTAQVGEWRSTYSVRARLYLCNQQTVAKLKTALMQLDLNDAPEEAVPVAP